MAVFHCLYILLQKASTLEQNNQLRNMEKVNSNDERTEKCTTDLMVKAVMVMLIFLSNIIFSEI